MLCVASDTAGKQAQSACAGREMTGPSPIVLAMRQLIMLELDLSTLRRAIGGGSYARGAEYARQRAVQHVTWDAEETALHGTVRGQGGNVYQTASRRAGSG
jgi:hypothetical protein